MRLLCFANHSFHFLFFFAIQVINCRKCLIYWKLVFNCFLFIFRLLPETWPCCCSYLIDAFLVFIFRGVAGRQDIFVIVEATCSPPFFVDQGFFPYL
ncbi:hypothetical protein BDR26DRAFT_849466 [Obelidium mucronatum]|nr:hypothetical protein BDR26DRAFT_849466 [Obelidium mucronatum]